MKPQLSATFYELMDIAPGSEEPGDLSSTLRLFLQIAQKRFSPDSCVIIALNPITDQYVFSVRYVDNQWQIADKSTLSQIGQDILTDRVLKQRIVVAENPAEFPEGESPLARLKGFHAFFAAALFTQQPEKPIAVLYLKFKQSRKFSEEDKNWLRFFTSQASALLQHTWFLRRYREVARIGGEINQELETAELLFKKLQKHLIGIVDISHFFSLSIYQVRTESLDLLMSRQGKYVVLPTRPLNGGYQWVLTHREPLVINHRSQEIDSLPVELAELSKTAIQKQESLIFVPLRLRGVPLGLLSVQYPEPDAFTTEDVHLLKLLGAQITSALNSLRLYENLRQLNETGQLLTRQLDSGDVLQYVVDQIRVTTRADLVILYPYQQSNDNFELPPYLSGDLIKPEMPQPSTAKPDDIAFQILHQIRPIFAEESLDLYTILGYKKGVRRGRFITRERVRSTAAIPLWIVHEPLGVLFINFRQSQRLDAPQKQLIQGLANYAAIAIKNSREFDALADRRLKELEILSRIDREISKTLDLPQVLQTILELATNQVPADKASILLYDARTKALQKRAVVGGNALSELSQSIPIEQERGITRWVFESKRPVRVDNVQTDPNWRDIYIEGASDIQAELDVPILDDKDTVIGIINFESQTEAAFSQDDQDFLVILAGQAVLAVKNAQAHEEQKHLINELRALKEIGKEIIGQLDFERIFDLILEKALNITEAEAGTLMLYDPNQGDLWMASERGVTENAKGQRHSLDVGITGWVAKHRAPLNVGDLTRPPWNKVYLPLIADIQSELAVPLLEGDELRGVINIESTHCHHFDHTDERLLVEFADLAVIALQTAERYQKAEKGRAKLKALYEVDQKIIRQLDNLDGVMRTILENAATLTGAEAVGLFLYEGDKIDTIYRGQLNDQATGLLIEQFKVSQLPTLEVKQGIVAHVARTRQSYITSGDAQNDPYYQGSEEMHSEVAVPLLSNQGKELMGILNLESPRNFAFNEDDVWLLELFSGQAVIAIQNANTYAQAERRARRFRLLHQAARELAEITDLNDLEEAYEAITQIANHGENQVLIQRYDPDSQELVLVHSTPWQKTPDQARLKISDQGASPQVSRDRRTIVVSNADHPPFGVGNLRLENSKARSLIVTPIKIEDDYYGNLTLTYDQPHHFTEDDIKLIEGLAQQLAITINRLETVEAQQEAEQRAMAAGVMSSIGQQAFELAHRLGNDLGLVKSYVNNIKEELQKKGIDEPAINTYLHKIVRDVRQVLLLSSNLKQELSDFRTVKKPLDDRATVPTQPLIEEAVQTITVPENVQVFIEPASRVEDLYVVHSRVVQILHNLLANAIEAMPTGGKIHLRARNAGRYVEIEVADTGVGIAREKQSQIFDFLYSTKNSTGFGLWSARRGAFENGGELKLKESEPDQGTTFLLRLPRAGVRVRGIK